jgi:hypothetical protein
MSFVFCYLPYFREWPITHLLSTFLPFQHLFTNSSAEISSLPLPFLQCTFSNPAPPLCARFQFTVYWSVFLRGRSVCPGGCAGLSQGWLGEFDMFGHLFGLPNVWQAGLEPVVAALTAHLFSQCNVAWRSFPQDRGSGCQSFDSYWCFISTKCDSSISARFWSHRAHAVCFHTQVAILDQKLKFLFRCFAI